MHTFILVYHAKYKWVFLFLKNLHLTHDFDLFGYNTKPHYRFVADKVARKIGRYKCLFVESTIGIELVRITVVWLPSMQPC